MKSPLVEALRQASGADETEQPEETAPDAAAAEPQPAAESVQQPDAAELELMETSAGLNLEGGILPIDGGGILPIDGSGILPIDGAADTDASDTGLVANEGDDKPDAADAVFEESTALQTGADSATTPPAMESHAPPVLPPNSEGEIAVRSDGMMTQFWGNPEASAERCVDGWVLSGDVGRIDEGTALRVRLGEREIDKPAFLFDAAVEERKPAVTMPKHAQDAGEARDSSRERRNILSAGTIEGRLQLRKMAHRGEVRRW